MLGQADRPPLRSVNASDLQTAPHGRHLFLRYRCNSAQCKSQAPRDWTAACPVASQFYKWNKCYSAGWAWLERSTPNIKGGDRTAIAANFCNGGLPNKPRRQCLLRGLSVGQRIGRSPAPGGNQMSSNLAKPPYAPPPREPGFPPPARPPQPHSQGQTLLSRQSVGFEQLAGGVIGATPVTARCQVWIRRRGGWGWRAERFLESSQFVGVMVWRPACRQAVLPHQCVDPAECPDGDDPIPSCLCAGGSLARARLVLGNLYGLYTKPVGQQRGAVGRRSASAHSIWFVLAHLFELSRRESQAPGPRHGAISYSTKLVKELIWVGVPVIAVTALVLVLFR